MTAGNAAPGGRFLAARAGAKKAAEPSPAAREADGSHKTKHPERRARRPVPHAPQPVAGASGDGANHPRAQPISSSSTMITAAAPYQSRRSRCATGRLRLFPGVIAVPPGLPVAPPPS